jgi:hypothetical protein
VTPTDPTAAAAQAQAEADRAALQAREDQLAKREAELALAAREQELAHREAELTAKERATKKVAATPKPVPAKAVAVPTSPKPALVAKPAPVPVQPIVIPAGTELSIGLSSTVSTKSASIGDPVDARLASDLVVDGRRAIMAGAPIRGRVTEVVSGSKRIGGTPTLAMNFDGIELEDGKTVAISGQLVQQGKSDTGRDTAKIVGGTAAGAIIGHQIDDDKGTVIGGILGGAAGRHRGPQDGWRDRRAGRHGHGLRGRPPVPGDAGLRARTAQRRGSQLEKISTAAATASCRDCMPNEMSCNTPLT